MILAFLACKDPTPAPTPPEVPIEEQLVEPGPFDVGYREIQVTYDAAGSRTNRTALWYPTEAPSTDPVRYLGTFEAPGVTRDPPVADGSFPLIAYSHGHQGFAEASGRIVSHLVSHGYIVIAPDHTGNTFLDGSDRDTEIFWQRATDVSAAIDAAQDELGTSISDDAILGVGHSFGGYTQHALAGATYDMDTLVPACHTGDTQDFCSTLDAANEQRFRDGLSEPRIAAIVSMAPGNIDLFGPAGLATIDRPVLLMTGGLDDVPLADAHWDALEKPGNTHVRITDGGHNGFSDFAAGLDTGPEFIEPELVWEVVGAYILGFARVQHGDTAPAGLFSGDIVIGSTTEIL